MSTKSEQHKDWTAGFRILLPSGLYIEKLVYPLVRVRDEATGDVVPLTVEQTVHQTMHAAIVRLWSRVWTDYALGGGEAIVSDVIPNLEARLEKQGVGIKLVWGDNLWFKRVQVNDAGDVLKTSCPRNADPKADPEVVWLDKAEWEKVQAGADTACFTKSLVKVSKTKVVQASSEPLALDFLDMEIPATPKASKAKTATK